MEFKYSLSLLFANMGYVLKLLVWVLICMLIVAAIGAAILLPTFDALAERASVSAAYVNVLEEFDAFVNGEVSILGFADGLSTDLKDLLVAVAANGGLCAALVISLIFLYTLYAFLVYMSYYPTAYIVNQLMSSNMRLGLASSFAMNFRNSVRFAACRVSVAVPIDLIITIVLACLCYGLWVGIRMFALPIILVLGILLFSARATLLAGWLPRKLFCPDESNYTALVRSLRSVKINYKGLSKAFVILFFSTYAIVAGFSVVTFGLAALVVPSINYFLLRVIELVGYYKTNGMSFYSDAITVVDTVEFGYRRENQSSAEDVVGVTDTDYTTSVFYENLRDRRDDEKSSLDDGPSDDGKEDGEGQN